MKIFLPAAVVVFSGSLWAQSAELWFNAGQSLLSNQGLGSNSTTGSKDDYKLDDGFRFGFRFAFNTGVFTGHEVQYAYNRTHLLFQGQDQGGMAYHQVGYNYLLYVVPEQTRVRPFFTGGAHFANFVPPGSSATSGGGSTKIGLNYGAGVKARITNMWALRFDLRRYETRKPFNLPLKEGWLHQAEISAGVGIVF